MMPTNKVIIKKTKVAHNLIHYVIKKMCKNVETCTARKSLENYKINDRNFNDCIKCVYLFSEILNEISK